MVSNGIVVLLHEENFQSTTETPSGSQRFNVERIIMHPNYNRRTIDNDIAYVSETTFVSNTMHFSYYILMIIMMRNSIFTSIDC